jgi:uncharacterized protein YjbJ (UPF0337 family)
MGNGFSHRVSGPSFSFSCRGGAGSPSEIRRGRGQQKGEEDMNGDQVEGKWKEYAGSARAHWSKLTDDDWETITGKKEHLVGHIQKRYGIAKEEAERQVDTWSDALLDIVEASRTQ